MYELSEWDLYTDISKDLSKQINRNWIIILGALATIKSNIYNIPYYIDHRK